MSDLHKLPNLIKKYEIWQFIWVAIEKAKLLESTVLPKEILLSRDLRILLAFLI